MTFSLESGHDLACEHVATCDTCGALLEPGSVGMCPDCEVSLAAELSAVDTVDALHRAADWLSRAGSTSSQRAWALALRGLALAVTEYANDPGVRL